MNRKIRQLAVALIACYIALFAALNYWQVSREEQLESQPDNTRQLIRDFDKPRGPIVTADGVIVARSVPAEADSDVKFVRQYPTGDLFANVTGYHTFGLGSTQIERTRTDVLTGSTAVQQVRALPALLGGDADTSGSILLTLREDLQQVAKFLLGPREGSIVVLETATGAVRAMWSYPSFDPNLIANPDYDAAFAALTDASGRPPRSAARQRLPAAVHAGLDVQGLHHRRRARRRRGQSRKRLPRRARVRPAADDRPDRELRGDDLRRRLRDGVREKLQHAVRPNRRRPRARALHRRDGAMGVR